MYDSSLDTDCPLCLSEIGEKCINKSGKKLQSVHSERINCEISEFDSYQKQRKKDFYDLGDGSYRAKVHVYE